MDLVCRDGGCFGGFFLGDYIKILYNQQKEAIKNDSREAKRPKGWCEGGSE